ncbi:HAD family hydrolase [Oleidesulfovibrio sp.]|uniref:HAD family hydrolase n=1 Tax=Oleidesulfovibrio sp. TaxID=2909707 RepID=UPI003A85666F
MASQNTMQAIAFDFDGTLADSKIDFSRMRATLRSVIEKYTTPPSDEGKYILEWLELAKAQLAESAPEKVELLHRDTMQAIIDIEVEAARNGSMFEGAVEMLTKLKSAGVSTYIVTRNCKEGVLAMLPDAETLCTGVFTRNDVSAVKPDPRHLLHALQVCGCAPEQSLMVGDHVMDIVMGKNAGALTAGITTGESDYMALYNAGADYVVDSLAELYAAIEHTLPGKKS